MRELLNSLWIRMVRLLLILHISRHDSSFFICSHHVFFLLLKVTSREIQACSYRMLFGPLSQGQGVVTVGSYGQVCIRQVWTVGAAMALRFSIPTQSLDWLKISAYCSQWEEDHLLNKLISDHPSTHHPVLHPQLHYHIPSPIPDSHSENNWLHGSAEWTCSRFNSPWDKTYNYKKKPKQNTQAKYLMQLSYISPKQVYCVWT